MPRLQKLFFDLMIEESSAAQCSRSASVELAYLRQLTVHNKCLNVMDLLPMITYPSTGVLQFGHVTRKKLVSIIIATLLPVSSLDFAQNLTRLRILPDPTFHSENIAKSSLYYLELLDNTGAKRLSFTIACGKGGLRTAASQTEVTETLVEFFSSVAGGELVSNVRELWVHN